METINCYFDNFDQFLSQIGKRNLYVYGPVGSGKTTLLKKVISFLDETDDYKDYSLFVIDPSCVAFNKKNLEHPDLDITIVHDDCLSMSNDISTEYRYRKTLSKYELEQKKNIVIICDSISDTDDNFDFLLSYIYKDCNDLKISFVSFCQLDDYFAKNEDILSNSLVVNIEYKYVSLGE